MARWQPRTPKENLETSLQRLKTRIETKKQEVKDLEPTSMCSCITGGPISRRHGSALR